MRRRSSEISSSITNFPEFTTNAELQIQLESFMNHIVKEYILSWYYTFSTYPVFPRVVGELMSQFILNLKSIYSQINMSEIILLDALQLIRHHITTYHTSKEFYGSFPSHSLDSYFHSIKPHPAIDDEAGYIREYAKRITDNILKDQDRDSQTVYILTVDIVSFIIELGIESASRPDMIYTLLEIIILTPSTESYPYDIPNLVQIFKNIFKPYSPKYYKDLIDIIDNIFNIKDQGDLPNSFQWFWKTYETLLEPILCGTLGDYLDKLLKKFLDDTLNHDLLTIIVKFLDEMMFLQKSPKPFVIDEEYEFVPYGKQRRELAKALNENLPPFLIQLFGGKERIDNLMDKNFLAVFSSKQRNKHLIYGLMDIVMNYVFLPKPRRTKSIKYTNSHLKIPEIRSHRTSYSHSNSYKQELLRKSPK
eukprot:NODE_162_length_14959_cov_1.379610.p3 type:complete len:420 gc:universal NODE_162_length_14959_cov_1.379610:7846-6587(-)